MTSAALKLQSRKSLAEMARQTGIVGWHSMSKDELVQAIVRKTRAKRGTAARLPARREPSNGNARSSVSAKKAAKNGHKPASKNGTAQSASVQSSSVPSRDLSTNGANRRKLATRTNFIDASATDAHWIRLQWDLTRDTIRRAETRLGTDWHSALPALRVLSVTVDDVNNVAEAVVKDVAIDAGMNTWFIHVPADARSYRVHIGYKTANGLFFALAKSNVCSMPVLNGNLAGGLGERLTASGEVADFVETDDNDLPHSRLGRPLGFSTLSHFGPAAAEKREKGEFSFKLDTELVVHGTASPGSVLTVQGEPIDLRDDGSFTIRVNQPEGRQVVTFAAVSPRGNERRMIVLGVERNTKELERQYFDGGHPEG